MRKAVKQSLHVSTVPRQVLNLQGPKNFLRVINSYADSRKIRHIEWEELVEAYPSLKDTKPTEGDMPVTTSVHCECIIAVHMLRKYLERENAIQITPKYVEIGISKRSCWFCQKYLEFLSDSLGSSLQDIKGKYTLDGSHC